GALEILVGQRIHALFAVDFDVDTMFHALQARELARAGGWIFELDLHRRLQIRAIRDERVIRLQLILNSLLFEGLLDAQHLLHLIADRELILEDQRHMLAKMKHAVFLVRDHARTELLALLRIRLQRQQAVAGNLRHLYPLLASSITNRKPAAPALSDAPVLAACLPMPRGRTLRCPARCGGRPTGSPS